MKQHKKNASAVTINAGDQAVAIAVSLEQAQKDGEKLKREGESVTRELDGVAKNGSVLSMSETGYTQSCSEPCVSGIDTSMLSTVDKEVLATCRSM